MAWRLCDIMKTICVINSLHDIGGQTLNESKPAHVIQVEAKADTTETVEMFATVPMMRTIVNAGMHRVNVCNIQERNCHFETILLELSVQVSVTCRSSSNSTIDMLTVIITCVCWV